VLMSYPALAQISSGTIIVFNFTKDELVVAADSRSVLSDTGNPDNSYCKIAEFHHEFIFTSVGGSRFTKASPISPIESWDNSEVARDALQNATKGMIINDGYMDGVVNYWASIVQNHWNAFCGLERLTCLSKVPPSPLGLTGLGAQPQAQMTGGVFIGAKGLFLRTATINFHSDALKMFNPVDHEIGNTLTQCWPCGPGERICAAGSHVGVAAQFCSDRKAETKISVRTALTEADEHSRLAVAIVEKTIDAYEQTAGDVGGDVDSVTIKDGKVTWNSRKKNCPDNQD
jgi:hypothetical protein